MFSKQTIPAFTMMDVLTGMVVMSLVVVMVFYLMSATSQQSFGYQKVRLELNTYLLLKADLKRQTEQAERIEELPDGFKLVSANREISYLQQDRFLLRKTENSIDTLSDGLLEMKKIPLDSGRVENIPRALAGVELKLNFGSDNTHQGQILKCYLYKEYGLTEPMNQKLIREF